MSSCVFQGEVVEIDGCSLTLALTVADGQSIAGMPVASMPQSTAFGLQLLVEMTWTAEDVDPRLKAFADGDPDHDALFAAAERFVVEYANVADSGFPVLSPGTEYNEQVEIGRLEPARLTVKMVVTDAAYLRHLQPGWGWDSPCGSVFE